MNGCGYRKGLVTPSKYSKERDAVKASERVHPLRKGKGHWKGVLLASEGSFDSNGSNEPVEGFWVFYSTGYCCRDRLANGVESFV